MEDLEYNEKCSYCRVGISHSKKAHTSEVKKDEKREVRRKKALDRYAENLYDSP